MKQISSASTLLLKRLLPVLVVGVPLAALCVALGSGVWRQRPLLVLMPLLAGTVGAIVSKLLVADLADEVYDCGDHLIVKRGGREQPLPLAEIARAAT